MTARYHLTNRLCQLGLFCLLLTMFPVSTPGAPGRGYKTRKWNQDVIYFLLIDRFMDGDPANNIPPGSDPELYDTSQQNLDRYHGGDLRGLELALQNNYFTDLGVTALWITPPVRNTWYSKVEDKSGYHGYWAQDFLDIDPHVVSRTRLGGGEYPDTREGRLEHYRDVIRLAHQKNIKVIQDVVMNHAGPVFYYDVNGNGQFDQDYTDKNNSEWIQPFLPDGRHTNAKWADIGKWNMAKVGPAAGEVIKLSGSRPVKLNTSGIFQSFDAYTRKGYRDGSLGKSDGEEVECDFFALRDFWTSKKNPVFDKLVDEFVEIYGFYIQELGVDGLRIDTVKHVHHEFWDAFSERLRKKLPADAARRLILFGEVYSGNPRDLGKYTYRADGTATPNLDSLIHFQTNYAIRDFLRVEGNGYKTPNSLVQMIEDAYVTKDNSGRPMYNPKPGLDGLSARQKMVNFAENHDGLNRFRANGVSEQNNLLASALVLTLEGIPCLYYGTEASLIANSKIEGDSEAGRLTFCKPNDLETLKQTRSNRSFVVLSSLMKYRKSLPALESGQISTLWADSPESPDDDGVFAFARFIQRGNSIATKDSVVVVVNANEKEAKSAGTTQKRVKLVSRDGKPLIAKGARLVRLPVAGQDMTRNLPAPVEVDWSTGVPEVVLSVAPKSVNVFKVKS